MLAAIIITACFIITVVIIMADKLNRALVALIGGVIAFFTVMISENGDFTFLVTFLFSSPEENFVNLRTLILIIGITLIIQVCKDSGLFQYLSFTIIKYTGHSTTKLMTVQCLLAVLLASVLNNVLTVMIIIPLTIRIAKVLNINPKPYMFTQSVIVNLGASLFSISSVPNILITTAADISFQDFFLNVGVMSLVTAGLTIGFFLALYKKDLELPDENLSILREFNAWEFVKDRGLMRKASGTLIGVMIGFVVIPPEILSPEFIALIGSLFLLLVGKVKVESIIARVDIEFLLYLLGIFVLAGALEHVKVLDLLANGILFITFGDRFITVIIVLWLFTYLGTNLDNISTTKVFIPVIHSLAQGFDPVTVKQIYYSLAFGTNWGDNLTPMGDNVIVLSLSAQNKIPITAKELLRIGFYTANFQLVFITIYYTLLFFPPIGVAVMVVFVILYAVFIARRVTQR